MKKIILSSLIGFASLSQAYTLNLPVNTTFKNKECILELGKKTYQPAIHAGRPNLRLQQARLITREEIYEFEIEEIRYKKDQTEFGSLPDQTFPTSIHIKKVRENALSFQAIAENWNGWTAMAIDCGVMVRK